MDSFGLRKLLIASWNTRGLGDDDKCVVVRDALSRACPSIVCVQESKLSSLNARKAHSFLPQNISVFEAVDAIGSRGGIVSAWDSNVLSFSSSIHRTYSLTTTLSSTTSDLSSSLTNVYAPSDHSLTAAFMAEILLLAEVIAVPWLVVEYFNLIRYPHEKNNSNFDHSLATTFNSMIHELAWGELPLTDRLLSSW
jgi:hypothetical protein